MNNLEWLLTRDEKTALKKYNEQCLIIYAKHNDYEEDCQDRLKWLASEHVSPIVLTVEERKAAQLLVDCGYNKIHRGGDSIIAAVYVGDTLAHAWNIRAIPNAIILCNSEWITAEPIDLREILKSQKSQKPEPEDTVERCRNCKHMDILFRDPPCNRCHRFSRFEAKQNG